MAHYRPQATEGARSFKRKAPWLGYQSACIREFRDKTSEYDWADLYLEVELQTEGSQYPQNMRIFGSFDKNPDGTIKKNTLLNRITYLVDATGWKGGVDKNGDWVDDDGEISDLAATLNAHFAVPKDVDAEYKYLVYVYKEWVVNKDTGEGKAFTRVDPRLTDSTDHAAVTKFKDYINFLKAKGIINEYFPPDNDDEGPWNASETVTTPVNRRPVEVTASKEYDKPGIKDATSKQDRLPFSSS